MPNEEMLRIERDAVRLVLSCCGGVVARQCNEGAGQLLLQSLSEDLADGVQELGVCLNLADVDDLGAALYAMMIRILGAKTAEERLPHCKREILVLEHRLHEMRLRLTAMEECIREGEVPDGTGA